MDHRTLVDRYGSRGSQDAERRDDDENRDDNPDVPAEDADVALDHGQSPRRGLDRIAVSLMPLDGLFHYVTRSRDAKALYAHRGIRATPPKIPANRKTGKPCRLYCPTAGL